MILAIDIGNTTVALGGIRDGRVCFVARMDTVRTRTAAEYRVEMDKIFASTTKSLYGLVTGDKMR